MANFTYHLQKLLARVGKEFIYKDSSRIVLVKLTCVTVREDELEFNLEPIYTPGFSPKLPAPFKVSGNVEFMSFRKNYISHPYVNFLLFTEPGDVKHLVKFAATLPDINILLKEFRAVMRSDFKVKAKRPVTKAEGE
ncbi:MAG: hypothetical protein K9J76_07280 [Polaromonas sp.]|nr:hypothetical protein [Polaromonas sp.]